jgi:hypothetical protein
MPVGPLDLVEIARIVVIDGRPEQRSEIAQGRIGLEANGLELALGLGRKIGREAVIDHFLAGRGGEVEVIVRHEIRE